MSTDPAVNNPTVGIGSPEAMDRFNGKASGPYEPAMPGTITCYFWRIYSNPLGTPDASREADYDGTGTWTVDLDLSKVDSTTTGYLKVVHSKGGMSTDATVGQLKWEKRSKVELGALAAVDPPPAPKIEILAPDHGVTLGRVFLVRGTATPAPGHTVRVSLVDKRGNTVNAPTALFSPVFYDPLLTGYWLVAVGYRGDAGTHFKLRASLHKPDGTLVDKTSINGLKFE